MKLNEIRLGNKISHHGKAYTVDAKIMYAIFSGNFDYDISNFEPIPLTKEWLLKFGFQKREGQTYYHLKFDKTWVSLDSIRVKWYGNDVGGLAMIYYVHQLQNLFFALEGEELQLK